MKQPSKLMKRLDIPYIFFKNFRKLNFSFDNFRISNFKFCLFFLCLKRNLTMNTKGNNIFKIDERDERCMINRSLTFRKS